VHAGFCGFRDRFHADKDLQKSTFDCCIVQEQLSAVVVDTHNRKRKVQRLSCAVNARAVYVRRRDKLLQRQPIQATRLFAVLASA
jgi:hypothetical protein